MSVLDCGCDRCGVAGPVLCFDCFMSRPFERDRLCPVCNTAQPIVRLYLTGVACDDCRPVAKPPVTE